MSFRFICTFAAAFLATVSILGGAGYAVSRMTFSTPRDVFRAGYFEFELSPGWWCELDGTEYICTPPGKPPHEAIAVIAMKERNKDDTLEAYEAHLKQPQKTGGNDSGALSVVKKFGRRTIGDHVWVESLHSGSEIQNFDTYYLGTTTSGLGILVTLSARSDKAEEYIGRINDMVTTLRVYQR